MFLVQVFFPLSVCMCVQEDVREGKWFDCQQVRPTEYQWSVKCAGQIDSWMTDTCETYSLLRDQTFFFLKWYKQNIRVTRRICLIPPTTSLPGPEESSQVKMLWCGNPVDFYLFLFRSVDLWEHFLNYECMEKWLVCFSSVTWGWWAVMETRSFVTALCAFAWCVCVRIQAQLLLK